jgi:hypothetical protein
VPVTVQNIGPPTTARSLGEWVKANTIAVAERALREEVRRGFDNVPVVITDGVPRRHYGQVKPFGKIEFTRRPSMVDAVLFALDQLRRKSPVRSGRYVQSHAVLLNGAEIVGDLRAALLSVKGTDRVQIVNTQPYAKKIEGRKARSKGRGAARVRTAAVSGLSSQAPRGVYERVVLPLLVRRYGRSMFFDFKFVKLNTGLKVKGYQGGGANRKRIMRDHVYPALNFFIKPTGLAN